MSKFNLKKSAQQGFKNYSKMLEDQSKERGWKRSEDSKNVNLSLDTKEKDNTVPYEKQIDANREGEDTLKVTEKALDTEKKVYRDKRLDEARKDVMPINLATEAHCQKHLKAFEAMSDKDKRETLFWDKYVGAQLLGDKSVERTKVDNNVPESQLENCPDRFKSMGKDTTVFDVLDADVKKMVTASVKDADAMLFHIYASASSQGRDLTEIEQEMINDIEMGKLQVLGQALQNRFKIDDAQLRRLLNLPDTTEQTNVIKGVDPAPYDTSIDEVTIKDEGGEGVVYSEGKEIDRFSSVADAHANYPEAMGM